MVQISTQAPASRIFPVTVNSELSRLEMITAGQYDEVHADVSSKQFLNTSCNETKVEIQLIHFGKHMDSDEVLQQLEQLGLRPATLAELLAFGAMYFNKQKKYDIAALGSTWLIDQDNQGVTYLTACRTAAGRVIRIVDLVWTPRKWESDFRFAAVAK